MKKFTSVILTAVAMLTMGSALAKTKYIYVTPKAPAITPALKPCIAKYREGNYTGAMIDLKELLEKEKDNTYAKYYLALCYTKLGYEDEAKNTYNEVIEENSNETLTYYSTKALACISDPNSEMCVPSKKAEETAEAQEPEEEEDDITKFIKSGKKIHPAAMDLIQRQRMEIKLQQDEYNSRKNEQLGPLSYAPPTNEEIAYALNTLAKIGINPFGQNYMLSGMGSEYNYMNSYNTVPANYRNTSPDIAQMLLYSQISQQKNDFINYGI